MRILALDIGERRIGVAVSDPSGTIASPICVLEARAVLGDGRDLVRIVGDYDVERIVVGLPLSLDGSEGPQAARVRSAAARLATFVSVPFDFADERLSSAEASRAMGEGGVGGRGQRGQLDKVAASLFLQAYLDARPPASSGEAPR